MLTSFLLPLLVLFVIGSGQICPNSQKSAYIWEVNTWEAGCARSGCFYHFKIRGPDYNGTVPAFSADCNGYNEGAPFRPCVLEEKQTPLDSDKNRGLAARLEYTPVSGTGAHIVITYQFSNLNQSDKVLNYTGYKTTRYNQFWTPPLNFTIIPLETNSGMSGKKSTSC